MKKLFWIDLEMTGLDVSKERVIEVAVLITDYDMNEIAAYETTVFQPPELLAQMDAWNTKHHTESGLVAKIPFAKKEAQVESELIELLQLHFPDPKNRAVLAGNSIAQDRLFIDAYFKKLSNLLHYRMLDVTAWKIIFQEKFKIEHKKKNKHRALDDIRESIAELKTYLQYVRVP